MPSTMAGARLSSASDGYDVRGAATSLTAGTLSLLVSASYAADGQVLSREFGHGVTTGYTYEPISRRLSTLSTTRAAAVLQDYGYGYDPAGNILTWSDAASTPSGGPSGGQGWGGTVWQATAQLEPTQALSRRSRTHLGLRRERPLERRPCGGDRRVRRAGAAQGRGRLCQDEELLHPPTNGCSPAPLDGVRRTIPPRRRRARVDVTVAREGE